MYSLINKFICLFVLVHLVYPAGWVIRGSLHFRHFPRSRWQAAAVVLPLRSRSSSSRRMLTSVHLLHSKLCQPTPQDTPVWPHRSSQAKYRLKGSEPTDFLTLLRFPDTRPQIQRFPHFPLMGSSPQLLGATWAPFKPEPATLVSRLKDISDQSNSSRIKAPPTIVSTSHNIRDGFRRAVCESGEL